MSARGRFGTTFVWEDRNGEEVEARIRVLYNFSRGYSATLEEPGSPDEIEIVSIAPVGCEVEIPLALYTDDALLDECAEDYAAMLVEAQEWRAQARRDDLLMEGF